MSDSLSRLRITIVALAVMGLWAGCAEAQSWQTVTSARQLQGESEPLDVRISYGAGSLTLSPADQQMLYQLDMRYDTDQFKPVTDYQLDMRYDADQFKPVTDYQPEQGRLRLGTENESNVNFRVKGEGRADVKLTREVPISLSIEFGAGNADLDLSGMRIRSARLATGASDTRIEFNEPNPIRAERVKIEAGAAELKAYGLGNARAAEYSFEGGVGSTTLDFSGDWTSDARVRIELGIGKLVLRLPRDLGVRIDKDSFLTRFEPTGLEKRGDSYYNAAWDSAEHQVTIDIDAAIGAVEVEWIGR